jgi:putative hydrolase of the HAD superfamily
MIRVISFDADGTLVDRAFMDMFWEEGVPELYARKAGISFDQAKEYVMEKYDEIGDKDIRWYLPEYWFDRFGLKSSPKELLTTFKGEVKIYPEVTGVLKDLKKRYTLIVISNAPKEILEVELNDLKGYFSHIFSSTSDFREVRKTPRFYSKICNILNVKPEEMVHVGDHQNFDFETPRRLGIRAFLLDRSGNEHGGHVLRDLTELERKIDDRYL